MGRSKTTSEERQILIRKMYRSRSKPSFIAKLMDMNICTVQRICKKWLEGKSVTAKRTGKRPKKVTPRMERLLGFMSAKERRLSKTLLYDRFRQKCGPLSTSTIKRAVRRLLYCRKPSKKKTFLIEKHRRLRRQWIRCRRGLPQSYWNKVIFSDECKVKIGYSSRVWVWSRSGEGYRPDLYGDDKEPAKMDIMVWGCITSEGVGTIYLTKENIDSTHYMDISTVFNSYPGQRNHRTWTRLKTFGSS